MLQALRCVTAAPFSISGNEPFRAGREYGISLNNGKPVRLDGTPILLFVAQRVRIVATDDPDRGPFKVTTTEYAYRLLAIDEPEIVAFHWTPETTNPREVAYPHLHVGPAITRADSAIAAKRAHKLHIPTGRVSIEAVIRFAIDELGAEPATTRWRSVLDDSHSAFAQWRTRG